MRAIMMSVAAAGLLAACSDSAPEPKPAKVRVDALQPGEYEVTAKVDALRSTDKTTPSTQSKVDAARTTRICVPADGALDPATFAEANETCTGADNYMSGGRMSLQYKCLRGGEQVTQTVDGSFTADSFTGKVMTATYFQGSGDYEMTRTVTAKRVGDCPPASAEKAPAEGAAQ